MLHWQKHLFLIVIILSGLLFSVAPRARAADTWQPISQEELKLSSEPKAQGAPAIFLYRQVDRDDGEGPHEYHYLRIKVLTEEGRKYANVEIPFNKSAETVRDVKARTTAPDGKVAIFDGKIYENTVVKAKGLKYLAKTFTLPDVQVGSIIEYYYTVNLNPRYVYNSRWILSGELFTRRARFTLKRNLRHGLTWGYPVGLPEGTQPPKDSGGLIWLETQDVPAFQIEDYMPPQDALKYRVDFIYRQSASVEKDPAKFWKEEGKTWYGYLDTFVNRRKAMEQAVSGIVAQGDTTEAKLKKIYARVQQLRNTSFETEKTAQEEKREQSKEARNVEDVWKQGAGNSRDINWLFIALAKAAGLDAYCVYISSRDSYFFNKNMMNTFQLNDNVVLIKLDGKDRYFDPGTAFAPYGLLPWPETGVPGLRLDKDGGDWVQTPVPDSSTSKIERLANLSITEDGTLEGEVTVTYTGLEALWMRINQRNEDETSRKKLLEDQLTEAAPAGSQIELTNKPDWSGSTPSLVANYSLKAPGWVTGAGRRSFLAIGLFGANERHLFEHANRVHPISFHYPYMEVDDITITCATGSKVGSVPPPVNKDGGALGYSIKAENKNGSLHITRVLRSDLQNIDKSQYETLRSLFQMIRSGDEQQAELQTLT